MESRFDLSIVIPTYNEELHLPRLLDQLTRQRDIQLQIIVVDGGSSDNTVEQLARYLNTAPAIECCCTRAHRAKQLNLGASLARAEYLLFLHADTDLGHNAHLLRDALSALIRENHGSACAGHFPLLFNQTDNRHTQGFYFYAAKTALNRIDVINGDQGFMLTKALFIQFDGFDESLPYMEDARLANAIIKKKRWITLPGCVETSARRFLQEGFSSRQLLNSFLCNFNAIGLNRFFQRATDAYRLQSRSEPLDLLPFLAIIHQCMLERGLFSALRYWYLSGRYVTQNAWQLAFALDCIRDRRRHIPPHQVSAKNLQRYDRYLAPWFCSPPIYVICAVLTYIWFYSLFIVYRR